MMKFEVTYTQRERSIHDSRPLSGSRIKMAACSNGYVR